MVQAESEQQYSLAPTLRCAPEFRIPEVLRPIGGDTTLSLIERHPPFSDLFRQIILDVVFVLEEPIFESYTIGPALRPDIAETVRAAQLQRDKVVQFADQIAIGVDTRLLNAVPAILDVLFGFAALAVADRAGPPPRIVQYLGRYRRIDPAWGALGIWHGVAILQAHCTGGNLGFFPVREVMGAATDPSGGIETAVLTI